MNLFQIEGWDFLIIVNKLLTNNGICVTVLMTHLHKHAIQSLEKVIDDEEKANGDAPLGPKVTYRIPYLLRARRLQL